jgi:tRNA threonylcarbamoyl adenosine modification protein YeaZ
MIRNVLAIETSGSACGVGIWQKNNSPIILEEIGNRIHSEKLPEFINMALENCKLKINDIDSIAISSGPGSYTGLRIGMSLAKGIAFGANIQLYPINTIDSIILNLNIDINYTILVYSHAGVVYEKKIIQNTETQIKQVALKDVYIEPVICVNFPENKRPLINAEYIYPSVNFIGQYFKNNFKNLVKQNIDEISPEYYSEFNIGK